MQNKTDELGLYPVNGTAGNVGVPGAPIFKFRLLVNATSGAVTGQGVVTQALEPPADKAPIAALVGRVQATGFGEYTQVVSLSGTATVTLPPPAIGTLEVPFSAHFATNAAWNGKGGWTLGTQSVDNVPVRSS